MNYAGLWKRVAAGLLDFIVWLPMIVLTTWIDTFSRLFELYYFVPGIVLELFYSVYLVRRFGGTPGKRLMRLRIRQTDGTEIGYREAFLRYLPELVMNAVASLGIVVATLKITDAEYLSLSDSDQSFPLMALAPSWYFPALMLTYVWILSEFVVMMTNRKRRAIHDFIAGTVVVIEAPRAQHGQ
jgi:uncharacterized RDD family membrane protein YckC